MENGTEGVKTSQEPELVTPVLFLLPAGVHLHSAEAGDPCCPFHLSLPSICRPTLWQ